MCRPYLNEDFQRAWQGRDPFDAVFAIEGEVFRNVKSRKTFRFELDDHGYFAKVHRGVGWREIFKNLLQGKWPILGATNEYRALRRLEELGVDTMTPCAYAVRGKNPAKLESFLVTAELTNCISLEDYCRDWAEKPPEFREKRALLEKVADMAGTMHRGGINHRDCYICHFLLHQSVDAKYLPMLFVIDLHRAQLRWQVPYRYLVKDVAGLWFSAMECGLTRRDQLRFIQAYGLKPLRRALREDRRFWLDVDRTARKLFRKVHGKDAPTR